jgi:hypothetical protein
MASEIRRVTLIPLERLRTSLFQVAIQAELDIPTAQLKSRTEASQVFSGNWNCQIVNPVICQLLQLILIEAKLS